MITYILIILSIFFFIIGTKNKIKDSNSKKWKETIGIIIESNFNQSDSYDVNSGNYKTFYTEIKYEFKPESSIKKTSSNIFPTRSNGYTTSKKEQLSLYKKLQKGNKVKVFYNPNNYNESCLIKGMNSKLNILFYLSVLLFGLGLGIWIQENGIYLFFEINNMN
ncbi:DUF3592 domain-containing protein [Tenacibaculum mesophilum]|uniref:DUF3592 domain-containing protein n=1 Tax=Tenacibaculum mesophilum TaxID=104268 RepID=UPI00248F6665|nr:DUF3592 domain-containing protein [Tenacibaculum mesophilum]